MNWRSQRFDQIESALGRLEGTDAGRAVAAELTTLRNRLVDHRDVGALAVADGLADADFDSLPDVSKIREMLGLSDSAQPSKTDTAPTRPRKRTPTRRS